MKLKQLPPAIRKKQRYILFSIHSEKTVKIGELVEVLWNELYNFLGEKGVAESDPWIMKALFDKEKQIGGIKTDKNHVEHIKTCITLVKNIKGEDVCLNVETVSGTMESARENLEEKESWYLD